MSYDASNDAPAPEPFPPIDRAQARERVLFPAVFLLVVGILNVVGALGFALAAVQIKMIPPQRAEQQFIERNPAEWNELKRRRFTAEGVLDFASRVCFSVGGFMGLVALLILIGAIRMFQLKSYSLAVTGSLLSIVPCLSPSSCLLLGVFAGVWSLVVLLSPEVREAFS